MFQILAYNHNIGQMARKFSWDKSLWAIIKISCYFIFIIQTFLLTMEHVNPTQTETHLEHIKLSEITFPAIFKFCFKNGFNLEKLRASGYRNVLEYFEGRSKYNRSLFGWAGHTENGSVGFGIQGNLKKNF